MICTRTQPYYWLNLASKKETWRSGVKGVTVHSFPLASQSVMAVPHLQPSLVHLSPCCDSEADLSFSLPVSVSSHFLIIIHSLGPSSHQLSLYPSSVQLLQDAQASEGQVVVLECRVRGSPPLQVRWYRQGEEILDSPDFRILQKSETFLLVIISGY